MPCRFPAPVSRLRFLRLSFSILICISEGRVVASFPFQPRSLFLTMFLKIFLIRRNPRQQCPFEIWKRFMRKGKAG